MAGASEGFDRRDSRLRPLPPSALTSPCSHDAWRPGRGCPAHPTMDRGEDSGVTRRPPHSVARSCDSMHGGRAIDAVGGERRSSGLRWVGTGRLPGRGGKQAGEDPDSLSDRSRVQGSRGGMDENEPPGREDRDEWLGPTVQPRLLGCDAGTPERTRTSDLLLRRQALYPLSYGRVWVVSGSLEPSIRRAIAPGPGLGACQRRCRQQALQTRPAGRNRCREYTPRGGDATGWRVADGGGVGDL